VLIIQTPNAIARIRELTSSDPEYIGVKIGVRRRTLHGNLLLPLYFILIYVLLKADVMDIRIL
jgi:hypothetical protein